VSKCVYIILGQSVYIFYFFENMILQKSQYMRFENDFFFHLIQPSSFRKIKSGQAPRCHNPTRPKLSIENVYSIWMIQINSFCSSLILTVHNKFLKREL